MALPFVIETEGEVPFMVEVPAKKLDITKTAENQDRHVIQELLFEAVKEKFGGDGKFFLIPSAIEVELQSFRDAQMYHPENFPMESDESIGFSATQGMIHESKRID